MFPKQKKKKKKKSLFSQFNHTLTHSIIFSPPFENEDTNETYRKILKVDLSFPSHVSEEARDLISKLLVKDSEKRISLDEVIAHHWIRKYVKVPEKKDAQN